jgi:hypothetical protein
VTEGPGDESPAAVDFKGEVRLFWQARDEKGHWQVYWKTRQGSQWTDRSQITHHPAADKEPGAAVDQKGRLRLAWRSQRRGYPDTGEGPRQGGYPYLSCTIDTRNNEMLSALRDPTALENHVHYTFDTADPPQGWCLRDLQGEPEQPAEGGQGLAGWCARQNVGIYLVPDTPDAQLNQPGLELVKSLIQGFLPIQVKVIFFIEPAEVHE